MVEKKKKGMSMAEEIVESYKKIFFIGMDATLGEDGIWHNIDLPDRFNWKFLLPDGNGRLDHLYYLFHYASLLPNGSRIVEIGTQFGDSALAMAMGIKGADSVIITIDPCLLATNEIKKRDTEFSKLEFGFTESNVNSILERVKQAGLEGYIIPIPGTSEEVLKRWDGRKIDMLFVDGTHTYEAVKIDCQWMQYIPAGGVAVFDDWIEPVERAVKEYVSDKPEWEMLTTSTSQPPGRPWKTVYWKNKETKWMF